MINKRYAILRRDLSRYPVAELHEIAHFVQTLDGLVDKANITSDMEILDDLEALSAMSLLRSAASSTGFSGGSPRNWRLEIRMRTAGTWIRPGSSAPITINPSLDSASCRVNYQLRG